MKFTNLSARGSKELKLEPKYIKTSENSVTRRLLEKYKPRNLCDLDNMRDINARKRVA